VIAHINKKYEDRKEEEFYCHFECFRRLVNDDGIMYIAEPDCSTIGEIAAEYEDDDDE
ncbi:MAG: hypothetical protein JO053_11090, partial [Acidobacteria bacterium]|nr:hypothetical protein [Acidobacteriota bacterium]